MTNSGRPLENKGSMKENVGENPFSIHRIFFLGNLKSTYFSDILSQICFLLLHRPLDLLPNIKGSHDLDYIES